MLVQVGYSKNLHDALCVIQRWVGNPAAVPEYPEAEGTFITNAIVGRSVAAGLATPAGLGSVGAASRVPLPPPPPVAASSGAASSAFWPDAPRAEGLAPGSAVAAPAGTQAKHLPFTQSKCGERGGQPKRPRAAPSVAEPPPKAGSEAVEAAGLQEPYSLWPPERSGQS